MGNHEDMEGTRSTEIERLRTEMKDMEECWTEEIKEHAVTKLNLDQHIAYAVMIGEVTLPALEGIIDDLKGRLKDYEDDFKSTINEKCDPEKDDRQHCTCVPHLKRRIAELEAEAAAESERITELDKIWVRVHEENVFLRELCEKHGIKFKREKRH